jgi:hypothetical protein
MNAVALPVAFIDAVIKHDIGCMHWVHAAGSVRIVATRFTMV